MNDPAVLQFAWWQRSASLFFICIIPILNTLFVKLLKKRAVRFTGYANVQEHVPMSLKDGLVQGLGWSLQGLLN